MPTRSERRVRALRSRRGLSLFEAVVSITIVGLTAVSALEAVGSDLRASDRSRRAIEAEALATSRLEVLDMLTDRELQAIPDSIAAGKFPKPLDNYEWKTSSAPLSEQAGVYDVRVTVAWTDGSYTLKSYQYRTPPVATRR